MPFYRKILRQAWRVTWDHKYLWFFGLFAAFISTGELEILTNVFTGGSEISMSGFFTTLKDTNVFSAQGWEGMKLFMVQRPDAFFILLILLLIFLALFLFLLWLSVVSQTAIVQNTANIANDKAASVKIGVQSGATHFWPILGFNIMIKIIVMLALAFLSWPLILGINGLDTLYVAAVYLISVIVFLPIVISLLFVAKYAIAYRIIKEEKWGNALRRGWLLFTDNWLISLEVALVFLAIFFFSSLLFLLIMSAIAVPYLLLLYFMGGLGMVFASWSFFVLGCLILFFLIAWFGSLMTVFQTSGWTYLFLELTGKGGSSKLARWFNQVAVK
ncbi:MAG: hypothetical protein WCK11_03335 [Candidatus Falkowbacteria bacterium]